MSEGGRAGKSAQERPYIFALLELAIYKILSVWSHDSEHLWSMTQHHSLFTLVTSDVFPKHINHVSMTAASPVAQTIKNLLAMQEIRVRTLDWEDPLEKEMASHSIILPWRIPWTEEPKGLQFMGLQRVGHDWVTNTFIFIHCDWKRMSVEFHHNTFNYMSILHHWGWASFCLCTGTVEGWPRDVTE